MSMQGNPTFEPAFNRLHNLHGAFQAVAGACDIPNTLAMAQLEATLALAFEQRTANLIALEALLQKAGADIEVDPIQERLGLE